MKQLLNRVILVVVLTLLSSISDCFRVRRSGFAGYVDPYGYPSDTSDMGRPRRGNHRTSIVNRLSDDDSLFNPNSVPDFDDAYLRAVAMDGELGDSLPYYAYERPYKSYPTLGEFPMGYSDLREPVFNPMKRRAYKPRRRVPTTDELRTLFGEEIPPIKRVVPVKRQEPEKEIVDEKEDEVIKAETEKIVKDKAVLANEWGKLINAAEKLTEEEVKISDTVEKAEEEKDLKDIFGDAKTIADKEEIGAEKENVKENKIELTETLNSEKAQSKSKRASSSNMVDTSDYVLGLLKQIEELKQKVSTLELLQLLEDRENDFLANALKYAALDQVHESNDLVSDEYDNIAKATETEEVIQQIAKALDEKKKEEQEEVAIEQQHDEPEEMKRAGQAGTMPGDQWLEAPVNEKVGVGAILEDVKDDVDTDELGDEEPIDVPYPEDEDDDLEQEEEEDEAEVEQAIAEEEKEENLKKEEVLLAKLLSSLSPVTIQGIIQDLKEKGQADQVFIDETCPAVNALSQNCAFADAKSIPIDAEARNLCIRHQICYTCGQALGISSENCDEGYKGTVIAECNGDVNCVRAAAVFLQLMVSRYHTYLEYSPKECANMCVADFIYGVE